MLPGDTEGRRWYGDDLYDINGHNLDAPDDDGPVDLVLDVVTEHLDVEEIAGRLSPWVKPR